MISHDFPRFPKSLQAEAVSGTYSPQGQGGCLAALAQEQVWAPVETVLGHPLGGEWLTRLTIESQRLSYIYHSLESLYCSYISLTTSKRAILGFHPRTCWILPVRLPAWDASEVPVDYHDYRY